MLVLERFSTVRPTSDSTDNATGDFQIRLTEICDGFGSRARSAIQANMTRMSQASRPYKKRGSTNAGPSHTSPTKSSMKKRSPNATPTRLYDRVLASSSGGTRRPRSFNQNPRFRNLLRHFDHADHLFEYLIGRDAFQIRLGPEDHAMPQHRTRGRFHVVGDHVVAPVHRRLCLRDGHQAHGRARTRSQRQRRPIARPPHDLHDVGEQRFLHGDRFHFLLRLPEQPRVNSRQIHLFQFARFESVLHVRQQLYFVVLRRIRHAQLQQKPVKLRFRQRIRSFELDRILRGKNGEELRQRISLAVDRDLMLFHALQQRRLRSRRHAVHFIDQQQVSEHRPGMQLELAGRHVQNVRSNNIGRHQIGRALHTLELQPQQMRQSFHGERLRNARHAFEQNVPAAKQRDDALVAEFVLPDDHLAHLVTNVLHKLWNCVHRPFSFRTPSYNLKRTAYWSSSCTRCRASGPCKYGSLLAASHRRRIAAKWSSLSAKRSRTAASRSLIRTLLPSPSRRVSQ